MSGTIHVNGKPMPFEPPMSVATLIEKLGIDTSKCAIERNLEIVPRSTYARALLQAGDRLEIVHFIGGG